MFSMYDMWKTEDKTDVNNEYELCDECNDTTICKHCRGKGCDVCDRSGHCYACITDKLKEFF